MLAALAAAGVTYLTVVAGPAPLPSDHAAVVMPSCRAEVWLTIGAGEKATTGSCEAPSVRADGQGAVVEGWAGIVSRNDSASLGTLAERLAGYGMCVGADGPYSALAAADSKGLVTEYRARFPVCAVQLTDAVPAAAGERVITVRLPSGKHLGALTVTGAAKPHLRGTPRRDGLLTLPDVAMLLGPPGMRGTPRGVDGGDPRDLDRLANMRQRLNGFWVAGLISFPLLVLIALGLRRRVPPRVALVVASYAPAGFAVGLLPWWRWGVGGAALAVLAATLALAGLGAFAGRRIGSPELGLCAVVAVAFAVDLLTWQAMQRHGLASYSILTGGRFYGLGNLGFAVFAAAAVLLAGTVARRVREGDGGRVWAFAIGSVMVLDALPGADFGGVIALAAALAAALTRRLRVIALAAVVGLGLALGIAYVDSLRDEPAHLGRFLTDDDAMGTVLRKGASALHTVYATSWPLLVVGCAVGAYLLVRPRRELHDTARVLAVLLVVGSMVNDSGIVVAGGGLALATPLLVSYRERHA